VGWVARRRPRWDARTAARFFTAGAVAIAVILAALQTSRTTARWAEVRAPRDELALALRATPPTDLVMSADPGAYRYLAGRGGIVTPNDPLAVVEQALRAYGVRWLALERDQIVGSLQPVLLGEVVPSWLSSPVAVATDDSGQISAALYAVCLAPDDERCPT